MASFSQLCPEGLFNDSAMLWAEYKLQSQSALCWILTFITFSPGDDTGCYHLNV